MNRGPDSQLLQLAGVPLVGMVAVGGLVFLSIWWGLYLLQWRILRRLVDQEPRFASPADYPPAG